MRVNRSSPCARARKKPAPIWPRSPTSPPRSSSAAPSCSTPLPPPSASAPRPATILALAETALKGREKALREVQERLAEAREARARSEARLESARERRGETAKAIRDQLDCAPEACLDLAGLKQGAAIPPVEEVEARLAQAQGRPRTAWRRQSHGRGRRGHPCRPARRDGAREGRRRRGDPQAKARHLQSEPRRPQAPA